MKIIDMHSDSISKLMENPKASLMNADQMINIQKLSSSNYFLQCFAMFVPYIDKRKENYSPFTYCDQMIDRYYIEMEKCKDAIQPVYTYQQILENLHNNKLSSLLTIEEGGVCLGEIEKLEHFFCRGVRLMTITWNFKNELASPNIDLTNAVYDSKFYPNTIDGLTPTGIEFIKRMNELGIIIDCSHSSDKTFFDVLHYTKKPIVCSHSCARALCNHPRNMSDEMLYQLKENGGVVGINFAHDFLKESSEDATIEDVVKHIDYIKNLIGVDYIGLGSDFDGISNKNIEMKDATYMPLILDRLKQMNYTQEEIDKISYQNVLRIIKENFTE